MSSLILSPVIDLNTTVSLLKSTAPDWEWLLRHIESRGGYFRFPKQVSDFIELNKTKNGTPRGIPFNEDAIEVLKEQIGKHLQFCFAYEGQPLRADVTNTAWHNALKRSGIAGFRFHDLRHTWASWHRQA